MDVAAMGSGKSLAFEANRFALPLVPVEGESVYILSFHFPRSSLLLMRCDFKRSVRAATQALPFDQRPRCWGGGDGDGGGGELLVLLLLRGEARGHVRDERTKMTFAMSVTVKTPNDCFNTTKDQGFDSRVLCVVCLCETSNTPSCHSSHLAMAPNSSYENMADSRKAADRLSDPKRIGLAQGLPSARLRQAASTLTSPLEHCAFDIPRLG